MRRNVSEEEAMTPATLTPAKARRDAKQQRAIDLLATTQLSDGRIAATLGVNRRTLCRWKGQADFAQALGALREANYQTYQRARAGAATAIGIAGAGTTAV